MKSTEPAPSWGFPNAATPPGSSVYYSLRFAPADLRDDLAALCGLRHQIRSQLDQVSDPNVALVTLNWWREELGRTLEGKARHPLTKRLENVIECHRLPEAPLGSIIGWSERALISDYPADFEALTNDADQDLGSLFELMARCHGHRAPGTLETAHGVGAYCALVEGLRDCGWSLRRRRHGGLTTGRLAESGLDHRSVSQPGNRAALPSLLAQTAEEIARFRAGIPRDAGVLPAALRVYRRLCDLLLVELEASGFDVFDQRISVTPIRKLWAAWRESGR